jgi:hypothetical protein
MSRNGSDPVDTWVRTQAAQYTTPESIRQRVAYERDQIRILRDTGVGGDFEKALEARLKLIRVLSERLKAIAPNGFSDL